MANKKRRRGEALETEAGQDGRVIKNDRKVEPT